ncbi:MAG: hemerythrin family protein [Melioribacteraceae bacterium]|nr:hemerythrin family protein [Melioribacteraceae bacterium]
MKFIEAKDIELTNINIIDEQHLKFAEIVSELYDLLGQDKSETIKYLLKQLAQETVTHFDTEEELMKKFKYENYFSHKMEHDRFLRKTTDYVNDVINGNASLNLEMLKSFKNWLINHIRLNDAKLGGYLVTKNI